MIAAGSIAKSYVPYLSWRVDDGHWTVGSGQPAHTLFHSHSFRLKSDLCGSLLRSQNKDCRRTGPNREIGVAGGHLKKNHLKMMMLATRTTNVSHAYMHYCDRMGWDAALSQNNKPILVHGAKFMKGRTVTSNSHTHPLSLRHT